MMEGLLFLMAPFIRSYQFTMALTGKVLVLMDGVHQIMDLMVESSVAVI